MNHKNLLNSLYEALEAEHLALHCQWAIDWDERQHFITLTLQFKLKNPDNRVFSDVFDYELSTDVVPFEMQVLFYDSASFQFKAPHLLKAIPIDYEVGLDYGELIAIIKYIRTLVREVDVQWQVFIDQPGNLFHIEWSDTDYQQVKQSLIDSYRYSTMKLYFPR